MKFTKIIKKNLKLLIRAKGSAFIVIFGPLLIILLVGLALNKPSTYALSIGYYTPDSNNSLTNSFINEMKLNNYLVAKYGSEELCIDEIKKGSTHLCIIFPKDFELGKNESNNVVFYADYSRTNLVYQIIGSISEKFEFRTTEISKDLTQVLLTKILKTKQDVDENILTIINMKSAANTISSSIEDTKKASSDIDFTSQDISLKDIKTAGGDIFSDAKDLKSEGLDAVVEGQTFADSLGNISATDFKNSLTSIQTSINQIYNNTPENLDNFNQLIDNATAKITILKTKLVDGSKKNKEVITKLDSIKTALENLKKDSDALKIKLESINANLEKLDVSTAEDIVSPIRTEIRPIISESNQLVFMFPYLLTLVIMFIGIMLSSSLIMMEKSSKAFFRNFTTPTKEEFFIVTTYFTSFIVLLVQIAVILGLSYFFLDNRIFDNYLLTIAIILITMTIFIFTGMIIGYISSTQESATMLSISVGSILLLLSNLILPIESMSDVIKSAVKFNPYVVSSELLKKTFLFKLDFLGALNEFLVLGVAIVALIILVVIVNELSRATFFKRGIHIKYSGQIYIPDDCFLNIDEHTIRNKKELLGVLEKISDEQFKSHTKENNKFANWVSKMLKEKRLAWKLRFKNREGMIGVLKKNLEKEEKKKDKREKKNKDKES